MERRSIQDSGPAAGAAARPRLLVVDDLEDNRIIISRRFRRRGFEVAEAMDGLQALERIAAEAFDLILLDIVMPGFDGFDVLRAIRDKHDPDRLPVVMATVRDDSADVVRALKLGANDYIVKPIDFEVAQARIEAQLRRKLAFERALRGELQTA